MAPALQSAGIPGLAHVCSLSFVGSRTIPGLGFPIALAGGTAIAHIGDRISGRRGISVGLAALIESVAILGPARISTPIGQLVTAPVIAALRRRGRSNRVQALACASVRGTFNALWTLLVIYVITGGFDAFVGSYDATIGKLPLTPSGAPAAIGSTVLSVSIWAIGASWVQVKALGRATRRWSEPLPEAGAQPGRPAPESIEADEQAVGLPHRDQRPRRFDPRFVTAATALAFALLLISSTPMLLGAVALWLALACLLSPVERDILQPGLALATLLGTGAFLANLIGGEGVAAGAELAARAVLLVLTATWMRAAAGTEGFREVVRRILERGRRFRLSTEIEQALTEIEGERRMGPALRELSEALGEVEGGMIDSVDTVIDWISAEAARFEPHPPHPRPALSWRLIDLVVVIGAGLPALALSP